MADVNSDDYYKVLGVDKNASEADIKKAYRKMAMKWHPDKNRDNKEIAEETFKKISEAYDCLSDPDKKSKYDQFGKDGVRNGSGGENPFSSAHAADIFAQFFGGEDPFASMFGGMDLNNGGMGGGGMNGGGMGGGMPGFMGGMGGGMPGGMGGMGGGMPGGMGGMGGGMPGGFGGFDMGGLGGMGGQQQRQRQSQPPAFNQFAKNTRVIIRHVKSKPLLNGQQGKVAEYVHDKQRYKITLNDNSDIAVKPENLLQLLDGVEVFGVESKPEMNGAKGTILDYDDTKEKYHVRLLTSSVALKPSHLILPTGTCARIVGLTSAKHHNGKWGKIKGFDRQTRRYLMQMDAGGNQLKLKMANVIL